MQNSYRSIDRMHSAIQLAGFHYIACLKTTPTNDDYHLSMGDQIFSFENIRTAKSEVLHHNFQVWAASTVLRDIIEAFSVFLTETYSEAVTQNSHRDFSVTSNMFERRGIEDQLDTLAAEFKVADEWIVRLKGYNRARNCLAHRLGIVGAKDATDGNDLVIRWLATSAAATEGSPADVTEVQGPMNALFDAKHLYGLSAASIRIDDQEKRVSIGRPLQFLPNEVLGICQTFQFAAAAFSTISPRQP